MISGITLVALIITIIILIILAAVTIKTLTHDGLVDMAIKGAEGYKTAEQKELEEMNRLSDNLNNIISGIEDGKDPVIIEGVITFGELTWSNHKASVTINKTTSDSLSIEYQVLNKDNQAVSGYQIIANGGTVSNLNLGDFVIARLTDGGNHGNTASIEVTDGTAPTINASTGTITTNSIQVTGVSAVDNQAGMPSTINYSYYIKQSSGSYPEAPNHTGTETSYKFTGLTQNISYDIKVTATDIAGNTGVKEIKNITTGTIPDGGDGISTGAIAFGSLTWSNHKASVTINKTTSDSLSIEYQVLNKDNQVVSAYQTIANGGTVSNLNLGDFVIARLTDGTNHGDTASIEVTDGTAPTAPTFGIPSGTSGNNGWYKSNVTVPITPGTDSESGVLKTTYTVTGAQTIAETEGTSVTITAEGTSVITAYTYDNAGHKTASSSTLTVKIDKTGPADTSFALAGTATESTITVNAKGKDIQSGIASYTFLYQKQDETTWSTGVTKISQALEYSYVYEGLLAGQTYNLKMIITNGAGIGKEITISGSTIAKSAPIHPDGYTGIMPDDVNWASIGQLVDYTPDEKIVTDNSLWPGNSFLGENVELKTQAGSKWKIWGKDDEYLYLISNTPMTSGAPWAGGNMYWDNYGNYNNGVYILDELCGQMYSNAKLGATAKSVKIEDIQNVTDKSKFNYNNYSTTVGSETLKFGDELWNSSGSSVPYILYTNIENQIATQSVQLSLGNDESLTIPDGKKVLYTAYDHTYSSTDWLNLKYHELVYASTTYLLSSRSNRMISNGYRARYDLWTVKNYSISGGSDVYGIASSGQIRPMVSVPITSCNFDASNNFISFKY